jgi:hypothetical protein
MTIVAIAIPLRKAAAGAGAENSNFPSGVGMVNEINDTGLKNRRQKKGTFTCPFFGVNRKY